MKKKKYDQIIATVVLFVVSIGVIAFAENLRKDQSTTSGTPVDIAAMNADLYQVKDVYLQEDGSYVVYGTAKGFVGDIETAVTFDKSGENVLALEVISQVETDGLGSKITEEDFLSQFSEIQAPIKVSDLEIVSPTGGIFSIAGESSGTTDMADANYSSSEWNADDTSPEAITMRKLYDAGLIESAKNGEKLSTAHADLSPEDQAYAELKEANLLDSSKNDKPVGETIEVTTVDAISGATISSKTVGTIVNNAYFFLKECVLGETSL